MAAPSFAGSTLPDAFVGVPYLAGLPMTLAAASGGAITAATIVAGGPQGLVATGAGIISGTVAVTTTTGTQVDGLYTATIKVSDVQASTASANIIINVHYLTADQDLSPAAQASVRDGILAVDENTQPEVGGVVSTGAFPSSPVLPTDIG
jgi:hypothetical protein